MERTPVRHSLLRRISWLGGDRIMVGISGICCAALGFTMFVGFGLSFGAFVIVPCAIFFALLWVARKWYKADPWMLDVGKQHLKYAKYYAPKSHRGRMPPSVRDFPNRGLPK